MRLTDLEPRWLNHDLFVFKNPTGGSDWLTCKRVQMPMKEQHLLIYGDHMNPATKTEWCGKCVVMTEPNFAWSFSGNDFATMTVAPSVNASQSGNWHGFITNGEIVGGLLKC